jgi:hypothetical protein
VDFPGDDRANNFSLNKESTAFKTSANEAKLIFGGAARVPAARQKHQFSAIHSTLLTNSINTCDVTPAPFGVTDISPAVVTQFLNQKRSPPLTWILPQSTS